MWVWCGCLPPPSSAAGAGHTEWQHQLHHCQWPGPHLPQGHHGEPSGQFSAPNTSQSLLKKKKKTLWLYSIPLIATQQVNTFMRYWFKINFKLIYTTCQKCGIIKIFNIFERTFLCSLRLHLFDHKYSKTI